MLHERRRLYLVATLLSVSVAVAACTSGEADVPRYELQSVTDDGVVSRHAEGIDEIVQRVDFPVARVPQEVEDYPQLLVEGVVNPPQSHVRYWYGPSEAASDPQLKGAYFVLSQFSTPVHTRVTDGDTIEVLGEPALLTESGGRSIVHWDACGVSFSLTGYDRDWGRTIEAAQAVTNTCMRALLTGAGSADAR